MEIQAGQLYFTSVPLRILVGDREYTDDETLDVPELLTAMQGGKGTAGTACPSPESFARAFEAADCSVCFTISSNLSGTYNAAILARNLVLEEHPEKQICVIDSRSTAGVLVLLATRARELLSGEAPDFDAVCSELRTYQASLRTVFTLSCYDNLIKNGRMRPLVGTLLHTLGIHVIADATAQGTIHVTGKARGEAKTFAAIVEFMQQSKECAGAHVCLSHCENLEGALRLKELILQKLPVAEVTILACRGLTSFYAMPGGLILGY
jgi:DegV family protein with EDD domain